MSLLLVSRRFFGAPKNFNFRFFGSANASSSIKRTALHDFHLEHGAKMVPFAGYSMPLLYNDLSIKDSHLHTRSGVSIFDVSHMLQMEIHGRDRIDFFESLVVADVKSLPNDTGCLTLYTTETGGIIDDLIVNKKSDNSLYVVSNASRADEDLRHLEENAKRFREKNPNSELNFKILNGKSLLAFQGPAAAETLQSRLKNYSLDSVKFMNGLECKFDDEIEIRLTRCGYTGEDGFEIQVDNDNAVELATRLLRHPNGKVRLAGLGARDSLRLEAGLCLYGNDIDTNTTPVEAALAWTIAKRRRQTADFPGAEIILRQMKEKPAIKRIGLVSVKPGTPPVRAGSKVYPTSSGDESAIGRITSGCPSPSLAQNIAMAYVKLEHSKIGTILQCEIRGKLYEYQVAKMPFLPSRYYV